MATKNNVGAALALIFALGFLACLAFLMYGDVPPDNEKYVLLLLGALVGFAGTGVQFFLGSSLGSAKKDNTISSLTAAAPPAPPGVPGAPPPVPGP